MCFSFTTGLCNDSSTVGKIALSMYQVIDVPSPYHMKEAKFI